MKKTLLFILSVVVLASCSAPKYSYKFSYHDYNAGRKDRQAMKEVAANPGPVEIQPEMLVAEAPAVAAAPESKIEATAPRGNSAPLTLTKSERKGLVKDVKQMVKKAMQLKKAPDTVQTDQSAKAMDVDLKMALIWFVISIAIGALIPLVELLWIASAAAFIVSLIYFIKWIMKQ